MIRQYTYRAALAAGVALACAAAGPAAAACKVPQNVNTIAKSVVELSNKSRRQSGLPRLSPEDRLMRAAQQHACWMAENTTMSHTGDRRSSPGDRARGNGYRFRFVAENVGYGQDSAQEIFTGWMGSSSHRKNILSGKATQAGVAVAIGRDGLPYWAMVVGSPL